MTDTIHTAAKHYATRPPDERFGSIDDLLTAALADKAHSIDRTFALRDLTPIATQGNGAPGSVMLTGPKGKPAALTHWSFSQLARMIGAPASYLRTLRPDLTADCLKFGIETSPHGADAKLLIRVADATSIDQTATIRAITSDTYARLWDADVLQTIMDTIASRDARWQLPPTWETDPATGEPKHEGAYRGDRDSFLILVNGGSIVTDPTRASRTDGTSGPDDGAMYRALMVSNSEVGARSFTVESVLYRYICGNHILWGAAFDRRFKRRHVGAITRAAANELARFAYQYTHQSVERDHAIIRRMAETEIAQTREAVISALQSYGATKAQAEYSYDRAEMHEQNPRSYWGIANGITRAATEQQYADDRYTLDRLAADVLTRAARLVAV